MKTKLLKKIRKQYSIVYYPNGYKFGKDFYYEGQYVIYGIRWAPVGFLIGYRSKDVAYYVLLNHIREKYAKYSRKYNKNKYKGIKVWYNG